MKITIKYLVVSILLLGTINSQAQDSLLVVSAKIDSLQQLINRHPKEDEEKVRLLNEYARECFYNREAINGFGAIREALKISEKLNFEGGKIMYYISLAAYHSNGNEEMFTYYQKQARWLSKSIGDVGNEYIVDLDVPNFDGGNDFQSLLIKNTAIFQHFEAYGDKEIQANILIRITTLNYLLNNVEEVIEKLDEIIQLYTEIGQIYPVFLMYTYKMNTLRTNGNEDEAKKIELELVKLFAKSENENAIGLIASTLASGYSDNGRHILAIEYYLKSIAIFKRNGDSEMLARAYYQLSFAYEELNLNSKAYESNIKCIATLKLLNDSINLTTIYGSIVFPCIAIEKYDEARKFMSLSLSDTVNGNKIFLWARYNDASGQIFKKQENYAEAIPYFIKAMKGFQQLQAYRWAVPFMPLYLAECYFKMGEYKLALQYGLQCDKLERDLNTSNIKTKKRISLLLSEIYEELGNTPMSFKYLKTHQEIVEESEELDEINRIADAEVQSILENSQMELEAIEQERFENNHKNRIQRLWIFSITGALLSALILALILFRNNKTKQRANTLLREQKEEIQTTLEQLEATQSQLIQSEKMASLGELTAGIAHEIQNPLNFVNNFSEVNGELISEMREEIVKKNYDEVDIIAKDIEDNEQKINHHGKRAEAIVKGMLQHSRTGNAIKELADINALADEFLRLSYHGLRAKDKSFNATIQSDFDDTIGKINIISQDIGRVILNLINNAFYAVNDKKRLNNDGYEPVVSVNTKKVDSQVEIRVADNGNGIPQKLLDKIYQPFFTTKPAGEGTGLGLSLSYDIITKGHGGQLDVETKEGEGTQFIITLPL